jgi:uncharacterized membrane protein
MTLSPLLESSGAIIIHAVVALAALGIGIVQFLRVKGDKAHRAFGWFWVGLMAVVAGSSFFIHDLNQWRGWSWIHLLSIYTLAALPIAVGHARAGRIASHRMNMIYLFTGALVIAGFFTLMPGRVMHKVLFGG